MSTDSITQSEVIIACNPNALTPQQQERWMEVGIQLYAAVQEVQELPDGYAFRYAADQYAQVTQFIANERLCCPFFTFTLEVTPAQGPLWLRITGSEHVKTFLRSELG